MTKESFLHNVAIDLVNELKKNAPVDTGFLRNSIWYKIEGNKIKIIMPKYAEYLEFGTGLHIEAGKGIPHRIYPRKAKALHWNENGEDVFAKSTEGMEAQPFIRKTFYHHFREIVNRNAQKHLGIGNVKAGVI